MLEVQQQQAGGSTAVSYLRPIFVYQGIFLAISSIVNFVGLILYEVMAVQTVARSTMKSPPSYGRRVGAHSLRWAAWQPSADVRLLPTSLGWSVRPCSCP